MAFGPLAPFTWTLSLGVGLHAIAWYIVAAAVPSTVLELGQAELLSWTTTLFLVGTIVGAASAGPLRGSHGARAILVAASVVVIAGCALAASAPSMIVVVVGRGLQGLGEGVILATCYTLARDLFPPEAFACVFAAYAVGWALGAVVGPIAGGALTEVIGLRAAFWGLMPLAVLFALLVLWLTPRERGNRQGEVPPLLRLGVLGVGAFAICLASTRTTTATIVGFMAVAALARALTVILGRRAPRRVFFSALIDPRQTVGLGLWIILLSFLAETSVHVFVPFLVQTAHDVSPTFIGYFVAIIALAWSGSAVLGSGMTGRAFDALVAVGPSLIAGGLAASTWALARPGLGLLAIALIIIGLGFGISYTFVTQRVVAAAAGEGDVTSSAVPTLGNIGSAVGAALAGLVGNAAGFSAKAGGPGAILAGQWAIGVATAIAVVPELGAFALARRRVAHRP